jgi:hypothetical protein
MPARVDVRGGRVWRTRDNSEAIFIDVSSFTFIDAKLGEQAKSWLQISGITKCTLLHLDTSELCFLTN